MSHLFRLLACRSLLSTQHTSLVESYPHRRHILFPSFLARFSDVHKHKDSSALVLRLLRPVCHQTHHGAASVNSYMAINTSFGWFRSPSSLEKKKLAASQFFFAQ